MPSKSRRSFLRNSGVAAVGLAGSTVAAGLDHPLRPSESNASDGNITRGGGPTFILVHSAYACAGWWSGVVQELALAGHRALAIDLPGHGPRAYYPRAYQSQDPAGLRSEKSPAAELTVNHYADAVAKVVQRASAHGPVVLAAHGDAGSAAITRYANSAPEEISHLVYVDAYLCVDKPTLGDYMELPENADALMAPPVKTRPGLGIARVNWRSGDPKMLDAYYAALADGLSRRRFRAVLNSLSPDVGVSLWGENVQVDAETWGRIPRTYVRFTKDRTIPLALQDRMIAEADALTPRQPFHVRSAPLPHAGPLNHATIIETFKGIAAATAGPNRR